MDFTIENDRLKVTKEVTNQEVMTYAYDELLAQRNAIQASLEQFTAARNAELEEVDEMIAKCVELGLANDSQE